MANSFQQFVRGCILDPELEKKAHRFADDVNKTAKSARETVKNVQNALNNADNEQQIIALAGLGLFAAGFIVGSMSAEEDEQKPTTPQ